MITHEHWLPRLIATVNKYNHAGEVFLQGHILDHVVNGRIHANSIPSRQRKRHEIVSVFGLQSAAAADAEERSRNRAADPRLFLAEEDEVAVSVDISQQEFRFVTHYGVVHELPGAEEAAEEYRNNPDADYHELVADITGLGRKPAKTVNFSNIYGCGDELLARANGQDAGRDARHQGAIR